MRKLTIMGAFLGVLFILGCSADKEFALQQYQWEQQARDWSLARENWNVNQQNLEQARDELNQAQDGSNQAEQELMQKDWDEPLPEGDESQTEAGPMPVVKLNPGKIPLQSLIEIQGDYGGPPARQYGISIVQKGNVVIVANLADSNEVDEFSLDARRFRVFWQIFASVDIMSLNGLYGTMVSDDDFSGFLTIDVQTAEGNLRRNISIANPASIDDKDFNTLLYMIDWLVSENTEIPGFLKPWED